jgi:fibronectin type 3 domain-containing protein
MFERHLRLVSMRAFMVAACMLLLAGCGLPHNSHPAAPVPTGLAATAGDSVVNLTWTASSGATGYNVKRATTSGGPYTKLASPTSAAYTDSAVSNGTPYYYVVSSLNAAGESADSAEVSATPKAPSVPPAAPTNLAATAGDSVVNLTWTASSGATSYNVKRSTTNGGPYTQIATSTSPSYSDTSAVNGTTYYYVVSAVNAAGESANSAQVSATPSPPPPTTFGTWINVTPAGVDLSNAPTCGNFGAITIQADPAQPSNVYTEFNCQGIWKSTDYGLTWTGPINTGTNAAAVGDCSGGITISPTSTANPPTIYEACIRGSGLGFWKSVDGGVNWLQYLVAPSGAGRQDYFPPVVDPYDQNHLLMAGHEQDFLVESVDGGQTWTSVPLVDGMKQNVGTSLGSADVFFVNTGNAATTRGNWLWMAQGNGGHYGTWRTSNSGTAWVQVDTNEHAGNAQIYQPDTNGVIFMAGENSALGSGVLRSTDYGLTWTHEGGASAEAVVLGTSKNLYAMYGFPIGPGGTNNPAFEVASQPGTGTWVNPGTPAGLAQGAAQISVVNDGTHNILVGAMFNNGLWRYIEP